MLKLTILVSFAVSSITCQRPDLRTFCTNVLESPASYCDPSHCQGRAGKEGPQGIAGEKGEKGDRGPGVDHLQRRLQELEDKLKANERTTTLDFCALGMKSRKISDESISTSSSATRTAAGKHLSRIDQLSVHGSIESWCAASNDGNKWIKVDLGRMKDISGILTQGSPFLNSWTKTYTVSCGDAHGRFEDVTEFGTAKVFEANSDRNSKAVNFFDKVISCRFIRLNLKSWNREPCVRLELLRGACSSPKIFSIYVESRGMDDGNTCKVLINGVDHAIRRRGHCVVVLNMKTNNIVKRTFDTYGDINKSTEMRSFIDEAPEYSIIAVAVRDATRPEYIGNEEIALFQKLGAVETACDMKPDIRDSWAFLTQKVRPGEPRPSGVKCQHVPRNNGTAVVQGTFSTSAHYDSLEDSPIG